MRTQLLVILLVASGTGSCAETRGSEWMKTPLEAEQSRAVDLNAGEPPQRSAPHQDPRAVQTRTIGDPAPASTEPQPDDPNVPAPHPRPATGKSLGIFRNTYYSFPTASDYSGTQVKVFDASCNAIASVPQGFHDAVCVQGSGRIGSQTISFAKRDCPCALVCPRSQQRICFEALDPARFPWGRGAGGMAIRPMRSVAVDTHIIALGTALYIPAFASVRLPGGSVHDGCFRAEDRGLKITGQQIDVFAGDEKTLHMWNERLPTGTGVEVFLDERCAGR